MPERKPYRIAETISLAGTDVGLDFKAWRYIGDVDVVVWDLAPWFAALGYSTKTPLDMRVRHFMSDWEDVRT